MAALVKGVKCLFHIERSAFLTSRSGGVVIESKRYVRGLKRKPVKVLFPESDAGKVVKPPPPAAERRAATVSPSTEHLQRGEAAVGTNSFVRSTVKFPTVTKDQVDGLRFERAFPGDKRLSRLVSVARSRTFREQQGKVLLEGRRLICDALDAGARPQTVFFGAVDRLRELPLDKLRGATLVKVKFEDIKVWSELVAPQGIIAIFSRPNPLKMKFSRSGQLLPLSLICDNIRDPGNLGTMLRSAAAAGCHDVLLTKGCVDAWEPKVLRAAMGAHFRLSIYPNVSWSDIENHLPKAVTVHVADSCSGDHSLKETENDIPRKLVKPGDYGWVSSSPKTKSVCYEEYDSDSECEQERVPVTGVEAKLYHESWARPHTAVVIGGETHGLSEEAVQLAQKTDGLRLYIPVVPDVDSLNSAMAASILLFEGRRQLLELLLKSGNKKQSKFAKISA